MAESSKKQPGKIFEKLGVKASVWQFFGVRNQVESTSAVCKLCGEDVPTKGGTTTCMISHLKNHHPLQHEKIQKNKRKLPGSNAESASTSKCARIEPNYLNTSEDNFMNSDWNTLSLDNCFAADKDHNIPISLVENAKAMTILQNSSSNYSLTSNQVALRDMYEKLKISIELELKEAQYVAVTIDSMRDFNLTDYSNVTCRFITSDWEIKSRTLQTLHIPFKFDQPVFSVAAKTVKEVTDSWSITDKVVAITISSTHKVKKRIFSRATFECIGCEINDLFSKLFGSNELLDSIRLVVEQLLFIFSFGKCRQALEEAQISLNLPVQLLRVESKSLCCSWYWSLKRIIDQKPAIEKVIKEHKYTTLAELPSEEQYNVIEDVCKVLKPLVDIIEKASKYNHAIVSTLLTLLKEIKEIVDLDDSDAKLFALAFSLKLGLRLALDRFLSLSDEEKSFALKASFLDPRFKNTLEPDEQQKALYELTTEATEIANNSLDIDDILQIELDQLIVNTSSVNQEISKEIDNYLAEPVIDEAEDPLKWWKNKQQQFSHLAKLARKYLCCSASCSSAQNSYLKHARLQPFPSGSHLLPDGANILTFVSRNSLHCESTV